MLPKFDDYADRYEFIDLKREEGILQLSIHTEGGPLKWGDEPHQELGLCFGDIAEDVENGTIIITGTGDAFLNDFSGFPAGEMTPGKWERVAEDGRRMLGRLLDIEVPIIAAVNGPAIIHAELALLSDIVICSDNATFADVPHFPAGMVPSDGVHYIWPALIGPNRARYLMLTGQVLDARQALDLGMVAEVVSSDELMPRAWELARDVMKRPPLTRKYARLAFVLEMRRLMHAHLGYGLALEGLAAVEHFPKPGEFV
jgi:enoyl-CoA hydratase/carnithine racemase